MPGNLFTAVTIRRRSAAHGCATAHPNARSARGGRDDQVDVGFGQDSGVDRRLRSLKQCNNYPISHLFNTWLQPCKVGLRYNTRGARYGGLRVRYGVNLL